jgi:hypothetical protein
VLICLNLVGAGGLAYVGLLALNFSRSRLRR